MSLYTSSEGRAQLGCSGTRIVSLEDRSDDGDTVCAALQDAGDTLGPDATDRENRLRHGARDLGDGSNSDRRAEGAFRGCLEDRPEDDEVRSTRGCHLRLLHTVRRCTDQAMLAEQAARIRRRKGISRQMHAVGGARQSDVGPIVDQEASTVATRDLAQAAGELEKRRAGKVLFPQLYRVDAALQRRIDEIEQRSAPRASPIGDEVKAERILIRARDSCLRPT
jgi:hypothetical protein